MIRLATKEQCTGCGSCEQKCSHNAISMKPDNDGFSYPVIDLNKCVKCHLCEHSCPILCSQPVNRPIKTLAARCTEEQNQISSSGGIFPLLARKVIEQGGIVFGAKFDEYFNVVHDYTDEESGLSQFCGAKYAQSNIGNTFKQAQKFLQDGRLVLYSGTPCQIAGLKTFLHKDWSNLITVDLVCKGVPNHKIWGQYLRQLLEEQHIDISEVRHINFRDKISGWATYSFSLNTDAKRIIIHKNNNEYLQGFFCGLYNRESCHDCQLKCHYISDFRLGDAWGFHFKQWNDKKGVSLLLINSLKGLDFFDGLDVEMIEVSIKEAIRNNPACEISFQPHNRRKSFLSEEHQNLKRDIRKAIKTPLVKRIFNKLKKMIR